MPTRLEAYFESQFRMIVYIAGEVVLASIGAGIAWFIVPGLRKNAAADMPLLGTIALDSYPIIVVLFFLHAVLSGAVLPRLHGRMFFAWIASGVLLTFLLVFTPFVGYAYVYDALFEGLR